MGITASFLFGGALQAIAFPVILLLGVVLPPLAMTRIRVRAVRLGVALLPVMLCVIVAAATLAARRLVIDSSLVIAATASVVLCLYLIPGHVRSHKSGRVRTALLACLCLVPAAFGIAAGMSFERALFGMIPNVDKEDAAMLLRLYLPMARLPHFVSPVASLLLLGYFALAERARRKRRGVVTEDSR